MRLVFRGFPMLARTGMCALALGFGAFLGRHTDLARTELHFETVAASTAPLARRDILRPTPETPHPLALAGSAVPAPRPGHGDTDREALHAPPVLATAPPRDALGHALRDGRIMTGATAHRLILFTFDDGPSRFTTPILLDKLEAAGVRAIFFLTGSNLRGETVAERQHQQIAREIARRGHILASHGYLHRQLPLLNDRQALRELTRTEAIFEEVLGARPVLFRPPGGAHSPRIDKLVADRGYTMVLWNLGAGDFQVRTATEVYQTWRAVLERREAQGERGGIVLLHDTYAWSVEAFQLIASDLLKRNCELLATDEELYDFVDDPALFFEARGQADASTVARPARVDASIIAARQARLREDTEQRCQVLAVL